MPFTISQALETDIPALAALASASFTRTFGHLYPPEDLASHLEAAHSQQYFLSRLGKDTIVLAKDNAQLVGYGKYGSVTLPITPSSPQDKEIQRLYVHHDYHGKQVAAALMEAMLEDMAALPSVYLGVYSENPRAQKFYQRYGFTKIGTYYYPVGKQRDLEWIMQKTN